MKVNLKTYIFIDVDDIFRQVDLIATGANIHSLRSHVCAIHGSTLILNSGKAKDSRWHINNINKHIAHLTKQGIIVRNYKI